MKLPAITTEGDKIFQTSITEGSSFMEAAFSAYPEQSSPIDYALSKPDNKKYMRDAYQYALYTQGLTIKRLAGERMKTIRKAYKDPKGAKAADSIVKNFEDLLDLYPEKKEKASLTVNNIDLSSKVEVQQAVFNQLYEEAAKYSSPEQIDKMIETDIIESISTLPPELLFEETKEVIEDDD